MSDMPILKSYIFPMPSESDFLDPRDVSPLLITGVGSATCLTSL